LDRKNPAIRIFLHFFVAEAGSIRIRLWLIRDALIERMTACAKMRSPDCSYAVLLSIASYKRTRSGCARYGVIASPSPFLDQVQFLAQLDHAAIGQHAAEI